MQYNRAITFKGIFLIIAISMLAACSSMTVTTDWDQSVDFSSFRSFTLIENTETSINRLVDQRIRTAIVEDLTAKGLKQADSDDKPDMSIGYEVATEQRRSYHSIHSGFGMHGFSIGNVRLRNSMGTSSTRQINFTVGTLIIAAFKMDNKLLIWEGAGNDVVNPSSSPEQSTQKINDAVQKILKGFPPGVALGT